MAVPDDLALARARLADPGETRFPPLANRPRGSRLAAVLVLFGPGPVGHDLVLVEKRADLRHHAGQLAFPGGRAEPGDVDAVATALREAEEEVGVAPAAVTVLGTLPQAHIRRSRFDVTSVVGWWPGGSPAVADPDEIAAVHQVPVAALLDPANRDTWRHPSGLTGPGFWIGDLYIWGFTAYLLDGLFDLLEWTHPWDRSRFSEIPSRFLNDRP